MARARSCPWAAAVGGGVAAPRGGGGRDRRATWIAGRGAAAAQREPARFRPRGSRDVRSRHLCVDCPRDRRDVDALGPRAAPGCVAGAALGFDSGSTRGRAPAILGGGPARLKVDGAILAALVCVSLGARLVPLTFSPLPFGIDGFALARISNDIVAKGAWRIDPIGVNSYNEKLPGFSLLWAAASSVGGFAPLTQVQLFVPLVTCLAVLPAYLLGVKATGRRLGGFAAGLFVAVFGSFLLLTSSVAKESIGLLVFPVVLLLFSERRDMRNRALAFVLLLFLPFLHPLTTLLTLGGVASMVVFAQRRAMARGRFSIKSFALDIATGPALAVPAWAYYSAVQLPYLADLLAPDALVLFLGIVILVTALLLPMGRPAERRIGRGLASPITRGLIPPAIGLAVVLGNAETSLFAGAVGTQPGLLAVLPAIFVLAAFILVGYQLLRRTTNRTNDLVVSMLA